MLPGTYLQYPQLALRAVALVGSCLVLVLITTAPGLPYAVAAEPPDDPTPTVPAIGPGVPARPLSMAPLSSHARGILDDLQAASPNEPDEPAWTIERTGDGFPSPNESLFAGLLQPLSRVQAGPPTPSVAGAVQASGQVRPGPGARPAPALEAPYAFSRTEFGWHDPVFPDGASGVVAPRGNFVYVAKKYLIRDIPGFPGQARSFAIVEVYTKAGVYHGYGVMPLKSPRDFVGGIDAYEEADGSMAVFIAGSFDYKPMVAKFRHNRTLGTFGLVATSGAPYKNAFAIMASVRVQVVGGVPIVYVLGTDWELIPGNSDGLADGIISRFTINLQHLNNTRIWTAAQGFPCKDEIEISSLYVDAHGVFTVADVDKQSDHFIGSCEGRPPRGGISRTSLDLQTSSFKKFDDAPGSDFLSSDSLTGDGNGLLIITGHKTWENMPVQIHLTRVSWAVAEFTAFEHFAGGHPGGYLAGAGMTIGGTRLRHTGPGKADLLVAGWVEDSTTNCDGGACSDWETWIGGAYTLGAGIPFAVDHVAFNQSFVSPTYDVPFDIAPDADNPDIYYQVGCSHGTKSNTGFVTDCYSIGPTSPNVNARMFKIHIDRRQLGP